MAKIKGKEMQTQGQHNGCVMEKETEVLSIKPLRRPPSGK